MKRFLQGLVVVSAVSVVQLLSLGVPTYSQGRTLATGTIVREVVDTGSGWEYRISKDGSTCTHPLP